MQKPLHENLENFLPYLKSELAAKGILSASLKTIFLNYIDQITKENRFVTHTNTTDRQIVYIERGDDALMLRFKYLKIIFSIYLNLRFKMDLTFNWQTLLLWLKGLSLHGIDFLKTHS